MSDPRHAAVDAETVVAPSSARPRAGLSIRSLLLIMLLLTSITSSVVVGVIGFVNGRDSLRDAAFNSLIEVRDSRSREVVSLFESIRNTLVLSSRGETAKEAMVAFTEAYAELEEIELSEQDDAVVADWFAADFAPRLAEATGDAVDPAAFEPTDDAARYLALHYTVPPADFDAAIEVEDAGDGSAWTEAHVTYHDYFRRMIELFGYEDVLLINTEGRIVYSAYKGVDLGGDLDTGYLRTTNLAAAYRSAMSANVVDRVALADFAAYPPSLQLPAAWAVAPVSLNGLIIGAIAIELPIGEIEAVMTGGGDWGSSGLGATGETYLVGADDLLMRSPSRVLLEHPEQYEAIAIASGTPPADARKAAEGSGTLLLQPVRTEAVAAARMGQRGTILAEGYLGSEAIAAYAPLPVEGLDWVIVAQVDSAEAFAPVDEFTRNLVISSAVIVLIVCLLSLLLAGLIVRPLRRLRDAARKIAGGEAGVQVDAGSSDELAELGSAFNDMSRSLQVKAQLLEEQQAENERLLLAMMPEHVARRYKEGARTIALDHQEVSVLFADIVGFEAYSRGQSSEHALAALNEILEAFDEAAERLAVERVRTTRAGYLASCGLAVPRVDSARRMVDFAVELQRILERFGVAHGVNLTLRAGIDTGTVTSGLVGQSHVAYDLWGDAVSLAFQVQADHEEPGIFVTQAVVERLAETVAVRDRGFIVTAGGAQRVWQVDPDAAHG